MTKIEHFIESLQEKSYRFLLFMYFLSMSFLFGMYQLLSLLPSKYVIGGMVVAFVQILLMIVYKKIEKPSSTLKPSPDDYAFSMLTLLYIFDMIPLFETPFYLSILCFLPLFVTSLFLFAYTNKVLNGDKR